MVQNINVGGCVLIIKMHYREDCISDKLALAELAWQLKSSQSDMVTKYLLKSVANLHSFALWYADAAVWPHFEMSKVWLSQTRQQDMQVCDISYQIWRRRRFDQPIMDPTSNVISWWNVTTLGLTSHKTILTLSHSDCNADWVSGFASVHCLLSNRARTPAFKGCQRGSLDGHAHQS